jgi:hypothetical protein
MIGYALGRGEVLGAGDGGDEDVRFIVDLQHQWGQWNAGTGMNGGAYSLDARVGPGDVRDDVAAHYGLVKNPPGAAKSSTTAYSYDALCAGECAIQSCAFAAVRAVPLIVYPASWMRSGVGAAPVDTSYEDNAARHDSEKRFLRGIDGLTRLYIAIAGYLMDGIGAACIQDYVECALRMLGG